MVNAVVWLNLISLFLLLILVLNNFRTNANIIYLGLFLVAFSIFNIASYVTLVEFNPFWAGILFNHFTPLFLLGGPFFYFYTRGVLEDKFIFKKIDLLHFVIPLVQLLGIFPFVFSMSFEDKVAMLEQLHSAPNSFVEYRFNSIFTNAQSMWLRSVSFMGYLLASLIRLVVFVWDQKVSFVTLVRTQFNFRWIVYLLISVFFIPLLNLIFLLDVTQFSVGQIILDEQFSGSKGGGILYLSTFVNLFNNLGLLFFPQLLYGIPKVVEKAYSSDTKLVHQETTSSVPYKNEDYFEELAERIRSYMNEEEPFLQKDFTLQMLSNALTVPQHHLTYCIRYFFNSNFSDLRNSYRIAHFKKLAEHGIPKHLTIDYLIDQSGFKSRSSFYASFSKFEGHSPSEYFELR